MENEKSRHFNRQESWVWRLLRDGDFEESEVWDVLKETNSKQTEKSANANSVPRKLPNAARMIPRITSSIGIARYGDSSSGSDESKPIRQQSAPVNIRDWSKIAPTKSDSKLINYDQDHNELDHNDDDEEDYGYGYGYDNEEEFDEEKEFNDDNYKLPPHEVIARRLARSRISGFEGVGRTLKGRDLSKVRNAVLSKTGFLEQ